MKSGLSGFNDLHKTTKAATLIEICYINVTNIDPYDLTTACYSSAREKYLLEFTPVTLKYNQ